MACVVLAYIVIAYTVLAYIGMALIVMAYSLVMPYKVAHLTLLNALELDITSLSAHSPVPI